jgi:hypothetical protein
MAKNNLIRIGLMRVRPSAGSCLRFLSRALSSSFRFYCSELLLFCSLDGFTPFGPTHHLRSRRWHRLTTSPHYCPPTSSIAADNKSPQILTQFLTPPSALIRHSALPAPPLASTTSSFVSDTPLPPPPNLNPRPRHSPRRGRSRGHSSVWPIARGSFRFDKSKQNM